ncbi:LysR substrate-binding domain-containing protein [Kineobactrum salinum]|uniref:LysR family transcriptional regulator n=1 Tax=Kineobactrum salinum TaxID=2708301 RepID=A0A6C0U3D5_9GAMM|nr:LysR substrate-binding domain-containing protein [Kineobactrum salinum]QIB64875.1 LysR family transcriptional regulator [Kineobactrum salinum]
MVKILSHLGALRCVEAAARHQSYSRAADELHVSQAAVSQQIRQIEDVLGVKLFIRRGRNMVLTTRGAQLATQLSKGFQAIVEGVHQIQSEPVPGTLNVTTTQSLGTMLLMPNLWKFHQQHPQINVRVTVSSELEDLKHGEMDVAIRFGFSEQPGLCRQLLFEDPLVALCSPRLLEHVDLSDPRNLRECWLVDADYSPGRDWQTWLQLAELDFSDDEIKWLRVSNLDMALSAVMSGHGLFLGSLTLSKQLLAAGTLVKPFPYRIENGVRYCFLHDEHSSRVERIQIFKDWLFKLVRDSDDIS